MMLVSRPVLANYYVTYRCNASCAFCDIWEKPSPYIKLEDVQQNLRDLKRLGVKVIDFTGGEPLLHRQLPEMLQLAKKMGFITTVTTNTLLYPKYAEQLQGKIDMLHFSLDSPDKDRHDASRKVTCFDFIQQSIQVAKSLGERPDIIFTVFPHNLHEINEVWQTYALQHNLMVILNPVFSYNDVAVGDQFTVEQLQILKSWAGKKNIFLNSAFIELRKQGGNNILEPVCKAASTTVVISPFNTLVLPCYHLGIEEIPIEGKLYQLYHHPRVVQLRKLEGRLPACQGCTINCYMQPSFTVNLNKYWLLSAPSALKYNYIKKTWKQLF
jgi:MoaA/NifB/PqqE/SkfB family radical SAM enzyme